MSLLTWIVGHDEENAQNAAQADARLRELNEQDAQKYGANWAAEVQRNYANQETFDPKQQRKEIAEAFTEGTKDGAKNISNFISGIFAFIGRALGAVLLGIPFWVWAHAGLALWFYLGKPGLKTLRKKLPA